jgi:hypothetical protein
MQKIQIGLCQTFTSDDKYTLAVGYSPDQVNSFDFSRGIISMHNHSCLNAPFGISSVQIFGMDIKQIKF